MSKGQTARSVSDVIAEIIGMSSICSMNRCHLGDPVMGLASRLRAATLGFCITIAPLVIVAIAQFILMPHIVGTIEGLDSSEHALAVSAMRKDWLVLYATAVVLVAIYWLLTAIFGKGQFLRLRAANIILILFVFSLLTLALYGSVVHWPHELEILCPLFGITDTDAPPFGFDTPSSCGAFAHAAYYIILFALLGMPVILLGTSLIVRIASSYRGR